MEPYQLKKPKRIFVSSMGEPLGDWVPADWIIQILTVIRHSIHTYQILTKFPRKAKYFNWPPNVWLGVTVDKNIELTRIHQLLKSNARIKFVSFEPLLTDMKDPFYRSYQMLHNCFKKLNWIILGSQTNPYRPPRREWVETIIKKTEEHDIPIFCKNNLIPILGENYIKNNQNFPK